MEPERSADVRKLDKSVELGTSNGTVTDYYQRFHAAILRRMRGRLNEADAEDVVQEIFIQALRDVGRYDPERSSPRTWLFRMGDQVLAKYFRSRERRQRAEGSHAQAHEHRTSLTPDEAMEVRQLLARLTPLNYRIIAARFLLGESIEEIATQTGIGVEAVQKRIERSLSNLKGSAAGR